MCVCLFYIEEVQPQNIWDASSMQPPVALSLITFAPHTVSLTLRCAIWELRQSLLHMQLLSNSAKLTGGAPRLHNFGVELRWIRKELHVEVHTKPPHHFIIFFELVVFFGASGERSGDNSIVIQQVNRIPGRGGRAVQCIGFENQRGFTVTEGSNPSLSFYFVLPHFFWSVLQFVPLSFDMHLGASSFFSIEKCKMRCTWCTPGSLR